MKAGRNARARGSQGDAEAKLRRRIVLLVALLGVVAAAYVIFLTIRFVAIPELPPAPELEEVQLSPLPPDTRSGALDRLLASSDGEPVVDSEEIRQALERLDKDRWLADPRSTLAALGDADRQSRMLREALREAGCLEETPVAAILSDPPVPSHELSLLRRVRGLALASVAKAQMGGGAGAAEDLAAVLGGLHRLRTRCANTLTVTMILQKSVGDLHHAAGFVLADPEVPIESRDRLARRLVELEEVPSELSKAIRREWEQLLEIMDIAPEAAEAEEMRRVIRRAYARLLWLSQQPAGSDLLQQPTPVERYVDSLRDRWSILVDLRIGKGTREGLMVAKATLLTTRPRILQYHRTRCGWAVRRARWMETLHRRDRAVPAAWRAAKPTNPFTGGVITPDVPASTVCGGGQPLPADGLAHLPEPPQYRPER